MQFKTPKDVLNSLSDAHHITPDGRDWLTLALDPFHDLNHAVAGYPDADCSQTLVGCYTYQAQVTAPNGVSTNWDAHIYSLPQCVSRNGQLYTLASDWMKYSEPSVLVPNAMGLLNIVTVTAGGVLNPSIPAGTALTSTLPSFDNYDVSSGITRIIGLGFEITNTTAPLNKQGSLTAYRMPQLGSNFVVPAVSASGSYAAAASGEMWRDVPKNVADANLLKGTRTWDAAEGCYATCLQNSVHNPLKQLESSQIMYVPAASPGTAQTIRAATYTAGAAGSSAVGFAPNQSIPFDTTGVFLMGLSNETTLTVTLRVYVERAPTWSEPSLAVQATPSAAYDVNALELYAAACNRLPPAVKVSENAKGDWWRMVVNVLKAAAGPIGLALNPFLPGAAVIGAGIQGISGQLNMSRGKSISKQIQQQVMVPPPQRQRAVEPKKKKQTAPAPPRAPRPAYKGMRNVD